MLIRHKMYHHRRQKQMEQLLRLALWLWFGVMVLVSVAPVQAQDTAPSDTTGGETVELSADLGEGYVLNGEQVRRLVGNVRLRQDSTTLTSNEAIQYAGRDEYVFTGNVRIVDEGDTLWAERVLYNSRTKVGEASPDVRLSDGEVWLRAPSGVYYVDEKRADLEGGITMIDSAATLTSQRGRYWMDEKRAEFYENVHLVEEGSTLEADSVIYHRETEIALANGNVFIEHLGGEDEAEVDSTQRVLLFGAEAYNDNRKGFSRISGDPLLIRLEEDTTSASVDTLLIRANVLEATRSDSLERLVAITSVRIWQNGMAATADSVVSDRYKAAESDSTDTRDVIRLFDDPVMWYKDIQVSGDTILAVGRSGSLDSLLVMGGAFVAQPDSATGRIRQLKGGSLVGLFEEDTLRTITVQPNAEVIYFKENNEGGVDGVQMSGDLVHFWFEDDELKRIRWPGEAEGTVYPEALLPDPFELEGYRWEPERKPEKLALLGSYGRVLEESELEAAYTSAEGE